MNQYKMKEVHGVGYISTFRATPQEWALGTLTVALIAALGYLLAVAF